ncbi:MAG: glycoside hydrolase [Nitrospirota bacterium]|nr:MAG: glycoside hydrolase [Nitrospirota bacterium]
MSNKIYLLFLWHMHQPYYKDALSGRYTLPWVRLHSSKDYLDMVTILDDYPNIRQNINIVPSLLQQIDDYVNGTADDKFMKLTLKPAEELTDDDKAFILENFFLANWDNLIKPFPRYYDLLLKRGIRFSSNDIKRISHFFSDNDFTDLQLLFNLAWIDPKFRTEDEELNSLAAKGSNFTEADKGIVVNKQIEIMKRLIPEYKRLHNAGKIELSVTPYFHPILPLLCSSESARVAMPNVSLPVNNFIYPEDAEAQIKMSIEYFENVFGSKPNGMWPSEGSVSEETVRIISKSGIKWIGTDEAVLSGSLGQPLRDDKGNLTRPDLLYSEHIFSDVAIFFRDHTLSDLIGFVYSSWDAKDAANDFYDRLVRIAESSPSGSDRVVSIILDGENAWEYYKNDGHDFLNALYKLINDDDRIHSITASEYLSISSKKHTLERLHAGSWIYGNFGIWIGHDEDNIAWDYIYQTRKALVEADNSSGSRNVDAWMDLYAAEGSDWFWWYGDDHVTDNAREFDELFRHNLMSVYRKIGADIPEFLHIPVLKEDRGIKPQLPIRGFIEPTIDGKLTSYFEWLEGTFLDVKKSGGSMHKSESIVSKIYYGFNAQNLFIRMDAVEKFKDIEACDCLTLHFIKPADIKVAIEDDSARTYSKSDKGWITAGEIEYAKDDILEISIPFSKLGAKENDELSLYITADLSGNELERYPWRGNITLRVPSPDFDKIMWY